MIAWLAALPSFAGGPPPGDPDWPCQQPLVESISAAMLWDGPELDKQADWRSDRQAAALVDFIAPREVPPAEGLSAIGRYLKEHQRDRRTAVIHAAAGLLQENNLTRAKLDDQIKTLARRQRMLADQVSHLVGEQAAKPNDLELTERWGFTRRTYLEGQQTLRYACDIPAQLDQRLGDYLKALKAGLR